MYAIRDVQYSHRIERHAFAMRSPAGVKDVSHERYKAALGQYAMAYAQLRTKSAIAYAYLRTKSAIAYSVCVWRHTQYRSGQRVGEGEEGMAHGRGLPQTGPRPYAHVPFCPRPYAHVPFRPRPYAHVSFCPRPYAHVPFRPVSLRAGLTFLGPRSLYDAMTCFCYLAPVPRQSMGVHQEGHETKGGFSLPKPRMCYAFAMQCPVLIKDVLCVCYAMSGTGVPYACDVSCADYALAVQCPVLIKNVLCVCYAMSGTDIPHDCYLRDAQY
eukprot:2932519-Rhodomonas_salina.1